MVIRATDKPVRPRRASAAARGYGRRWRQARQRHLLAEPLCRACKAAGKAVPASVVDHVEPPESATDPLFWDCHNWQSLCKPCHDRKTLSQSIRGRRMQ